MDGSEKNEEMPVANIVVAGIVGVGKSTLVNAVFGWDEARTGVGSAVTEHMTEYKKPGVPVQVWDTVGFELDSLKTQKAIRDIRKKIEEKAISRSERDCIHAIWYCVFSGSNRYQKEEIGFVKSLHESKVPFIIVLTQCIDDTEDINQLEEYIRTANEEAGMGDIDVVQVLAEDYKTRLGTIKSFGLPELINKTTEKMPEFLASSFIAAQNVCRENKRSECEKIILSYVEKALNGFWDNVLFVNIPITSDNIKRLLIDISQMYNQIIDEATLDREVAGLNLKFEAIWNGLIVPWKGKYGRRVQEMFEKKVGNGYEGDFCDLPDNAKSARLIAYYGCIFIDSVEETWDWKNQKKIEEIEEYVEKLVDNINKRLKKDKADQASKEGKKQRQTI